MTETSTRARLRACDKCGARSDAESAFCQQCGENFDGVVAVARAEPRPATFPPMKNLAVEDHKKKLRSARIAIMVVAVLTMGAAVLAWIGLHAAMDRALAQPGFVINQDVVSQARLQLGLTFGLGLVFFGLFFWAKANAIAATQTALCLYVGSIVLAAASDPQTLARGFILKLIIIAVLMRGVTAARGTAARES